MKIKPFFFALSVIAILYSCSGGEPRIARSVGATSEILVVTQNEGQWNGPIGEAVRAFFGREQYGLPQGEPTYKVTSINVAKLSDMFKKHRNLFVIEIDPKLKEAIVEARTDVWSKPQRIIKITAPDATTWLDAFDKQKEGLMLLYDQTERERLMNIFRPTAKVDVMEAVFKAFALKMTIPEGFYIAKSEPGFMWIRKETNDFSQGFILYQRPYRDTTQFTLNRLVRLRDSLVMQHIPGPSDGSFMSTEREFTPPVSHPTAHFVTDYAVEMRGMWNVTGDFMAGPYVSFTFVNPVSKQLVTAEGYVYAPGKDKRDLLRQLEALLYSITF
ncbi:MAG: DUF4837 family protein [Bacteroidales bacterium]|nr:DUF4837 family protein [Bacteroidales bacterium]